MTTGGGNKRRKLDNRQILSSSSPSYLRLRSRTLVIKALEKEKKTKKRLAEGEESVNYVEEEVVNVVEVEAERKGLGWRSERSEVGGGEETEDDGCFESTSCNFSIEDQRTEVKMSQGELRADVDGEDRELGNLESIARRGSDGRPDRRSTAGKETSIKNLSAKMPSEEEIEGFFAAVETEQRKKFMDKYNYDFVNDVPMEGRYQWIKAETMKL